jgi:uncharacterized phiE125 gp8 family phage protein
MAKKPGQTPMSLDSAIALASAAEARVVLKISGSGEDTILEDLINRASAFANKFTGRQLLEAAITEYYDGDGTDELALNNYPVSAVTSVHDDVLRVFGSTTEIVAGDRILDGAAGIIKLWNSAFSFIKGKRNVRVVYTAGYPSASIPHDLKEAVLMIVQHHYKRVYQDQRIGLASETISDHTIQYSEDAIPKKAADTLARYRRINSGNLGHA